MGLSVESPLFYLKSNVLKAEKFLKITMNCLLTSKHNNVIIKNVINEMIMII